MTALNPIRKRNYWVQLPHNLRFYTEKYSYLLPAMSVSKTGLDEEGRWLGTRNYPDMLFTVTATEAEKMVVLETNYSVSLCNVCIMKF